MVENHDSNRIRRSNSASSSLGLSVLLDVDKKSYNDRSLNDYHGFKVISTLENFFVLLALMIHMNAGSGPQPI